MRPTQCSRGCPIIGCHVFACFWRKHVPCSPRVGRDSKTTPSAVGTCFRQQPQKHGATDVPNGSDGPNTARELKRRVRPDFLAGLSSARRAESRPRKGTVQPRPVRRTPSGSEAPAWVSGPHIRGALLKGRKLLSCSCCALSGLVGSGRRQPRAALRSAPGSTDRPKAVRNQPLGLKARPSHRRKTPRRNQLCPARNNCHTSAVRPNQSAQICEICG
jgi:hypothetical protein